MEVPTAADAQSTQQKFQDTEELLRLWDLPHLIPIFYNKRLYKDIFHLLTNNDINELIPESDMTSRLKFRAKLIEWRNQYDCSIEVDSKGNAQRPDIIQHPGYFSAIRPQYQFAISCLIIAIVAIFIAVIYFTIIKPSNDEFAAVERDNNIRNKEGFHGF